MNELKLIVLPKFTTDKPICGDFEYRIKVKDVNGNPLIGSTIALILPMNGNPPTLKVWTQDVTQTDSSPFTVTY